MKYMLDTNICIFLMKKRSLSILDRLQSLAVGDVGISSITVSEMMFGVEKSLYKEKNASALQQFLVPLEVAEFGFESAQKYGYIHDYLESKGNVIGPLDMLIAAHAKSLKATLVTNNTKEFSRVPNLCIEDWS